MSSTQFPGTRDRGCLTIAEVVRGAKNGPLGSREGGRKWAPEHAQASLQVHSPSAQVKAAAAQVGDLNWNGQKKNVIAHYWGSRNDFSVAALPDR
jgi:hypothetical protein